MAAKKQQTHAKKTRELAVKEKRERKRAKKAEAAALRAAGVELPPPANGDDQGADGQAQMDAVAEGAR
jgi:hypothetical protein